MTGGGPSLVERARAWAEADPDGESRAALLALASAGDVSALEGAFEPPLTFGTAGLRGIVGPGPSRMNHAVLRRTTRAVADHLVRTVPDARALPVVIGFDARHSSRAFAETAIAVLEAARLPVRYFTEPVPTPLVAYAVRRLSATAGIVVTASHNPKDYNGYKLYGANGSQILSPADAEIERLVQNVGPAIGVPVSDFRFEEATRGGPAIEPHRREDSGGAAPIDAALVDGYLGAVDLLRPPGDADRDFPIVYTPLHGVGAGMATRALSRAGFRDVRVVPEQAVPDGAFPTVGFPNPEEPGTLDLALRLAEKEDAPLVLANDPDADRLAVAVRSASGRLVPLSGNQIGVLLADFLLERTPPGQKPLVVWSIVSSPMLASIAAAYGARAERTLTGFKWISRAGLELEQRENLRFVLGYEEALGFAVGRDVRDKDGISAAVVFAELAAQARARGEGVLDVLARLYHRHGLWVSAQRSVVRAGPRGVAGFVHAVDRLAAAPPETLGDYRVSAVRDYRKGAAERPFWLGATPLVEMELGAGGRVLLRPSGTEPKLKIYVDLRAEVPPEASVWSAEERISAAAASVAAAAAQRLEELEDAG